MTERFQNKYRIASSRLQTWDYSTAAAYFITICAKNREHYFGEIVNGKMHLSSAGIVADILWHEIRNHAENVELGEFVVMPNHIHGILMLYEAVGQGDGPLNGGINGEMNGENGGIATGAVGGDAVDHGHPMVETRPALSLRFPGSPSPGSPSPSPQSGQQPKTIGQQRFQNQGKNTISSIVGSYKSAVTKHCNRLGVEFGWQSRFYDHIIRDAQSFERIQNYIAANPATWQEDKFYTRYK